MWENRQMWESVIGRNEFAQERNRSLEEWGKSESHNLGAPVGEYESERNRELEKEM